MATGERQRERDAGKISQREKPPRGLLSVFAFVPSALKHIIYSKSHNSPGSRGRKAKVFCGIKRYTF